MRRCPRCGAEMTFLDYREAAAASHPAMYEEKYRSLHEETRPKEAYYYCPECGHILTEDVVLNILPRRR